MKKKVISATLVSIMAIGFVSTSASAFFELPPPERSTQPNPYIVKDGWKIKLVPVSPVIGIPLPTDPTIKFK